MAAGWLLTSRSSNKLQTARWFVHHEATDCKTAGGERLMMREFWPRDCGPHDAGNEAAAGEMLLSLPVTLEAHCVTMRLLAATADTKLLVARVLARRLR